MYFTASRKVHTGQENRGAGAEQKSYQAKYQPNPIHAATVHAMTEKASAVKTRLLEIADHLEKTASGIGTFAAGDGQVQDHAAKKMQDVPVPPSRDDESHRKALAGGQDLDDDIRWDA